MSSSDPPDQQGPALINTDMWVVSLFMTGLSTLIDVVVFSLFRSNTGYFLLFDIAVQDIYPSAHCEMFEETNLKPECPSTNLSSFTN